MSVLPTIASACALAPGRKAEIAAAGFADLALALLTAVERALPEPDADCEALLAAPPPRPELIRALEAWAGRGVGVLAELNALAVELRAASERGRGHDSEEADAIAGRIDRLRGLIFPQWRKDAARVAAETNQPQGGGT